MKESDSRGSNSEISFEYLNTCLLLRAEVRGG